MSQPALPVQRTGAGSILHEKPHRLQAAHMARKAPPAASKKGNEEQQLFIIKCSVSLAAGLHNIGVFYLRHGGANHDKAAYLLLPCQTRPMQRGVALRICQPNVLQQEPQRRKQDFATTRERAR